MISVLNLISLFASDSLAGDNEVEEEDDEVIARLLEENLEEEISSNLSSSWPGSAIDESPSPMPGE